MLADHLGALMKIFMGSSMGLALLVWVGGDLLKRVLYFFGNEPSSGQKSPILHLPLADGCLCQHQRYW